jgi:hypothetical protein
MDKGKIRLLIGLSAAVLLAACGTPGPPVVPSLQLPAPPGNLQATRKGSRVTLRWTPPSLTTDGQTIRARYAGPTFVCRSVGLAPAQKCEKIGQVAEVVPQAPGRGKRRGPANEPIEFVDALPEALMLAHPTALAQYAVQPENARGRTAGMSTQVSVPLAPVPPPAAGVAAEVTAEGVWIRWCPAEMPKVAGLKYGARVSRQEVDSKTAPVTVAGKTIAAPDGQCAGRRAILDREFEWEKPYRYWVVGVTTVAGKTPVTVEGEDSPAVAVRPHDIYPPAVPVEVEAMASGVGQKPFIDLAWRADADADLAGYNVYRREADGQWSKRNAAPVPVPAFRDEEVTPGMTYTYVVTAVDVRGNESRRSEAASETLPQP